MTWFPLIVIFIEHPNPSYHDKYILMIVGTSHIFHIFLLLTYRYLMFYISLSSILAQLHYFSRFSYSWYFYLPMVSYFRYNIYVMHEWCSITLILEIIKKYTSQLDMLEGLKYDNSSCYFQNDSITKKGDDYHKQKWFEIDCFIFLFY